MKRHFAVIAVSIIGGALLFQPGVTAWMEQGLNIVLSFYKVETMQRNIYVALLLFFEGGYIIPQIKRRVRKLKRDIAVKRAAAQEAADDAADN